MPHKMSVSIYQLVLIDNIFTQEENLFKMNIFYHKYDTHARVFVTACDFEQVNKKFTAFSIKNSKKVKIR